MAAPAQWPGRGEGDRGGRVRACRIGRVECGGAPAGGGLDARASARTTQIRVLAPSAQSGLQAAGRLRQVAGMRISSKVLLVTLAGATTPGTSAAQPRPSGCVAPGIEVLLTDSIHLIRGKRVGLLTNHSGRDRKGTSSIDLLFKAPGVKLTALFAPEHGDRKSTRL